MASLDLIYISSDDEKDSSNNKTKLKGQRPQHQHHASRVGARAKSVDPTGEPPVRIIKRSKSAPSKVSFASATPLSKSDLTSKERSNSATSPDTIATNSTSEAGARTNQSTPTTPSLDPPIEPLHFPERYEIAPCGETSTSVDSGTMGSKPQPTNTSASMDGPDDHRIPSSPDRSESLPAKPAANKTDKDLNSLKRKHDHATASEPPKRPRTATPTYIPRHLPYHPSMGAAQKPAPRNHAPYYSLTSAPAYPPLPVSNRTLWATPAYDPSMDRKAADGTNASFAPPPLPTGAEKPGHSPPITTQQQQQQQQPPDPPPKTRKRQWNCGMLSDLATELQKTFDAQSFSTKHGMDIKEVLKVFTIYVHQPLSAFSARGLSRAKMKEFKEKMKEHDRKVKEAAVAGEDAGGGGRRRGRKTPVDHVKPRERKESRSGKSENTPQVLERKLSSAIPANAHSARNI